ncbi:transglutaminase family protein [Candidatus Poribacteria bacterium]
MTWQPPEGMDEYLKPTELCDSDNEEVKKKAQELTKDADNPKQAAIGIFHFVRDQIPFGTDRSDTRASDTLRIGTGHCCPKANLQVALLRSIGIPARYHQVVLSKEVLKGILPDRIHRMLPEKIWYHPWCECYLSGKWISCESLFDKALYDAAVRKEVLSKEQMPMIDWDGENDLTMVGSWMLEDKGTFSSLDDVFREAESEHNLPGFIAGIARYFSNRYISKLRKS